MNEITKIHLGRQAFTIAVDAHKALQAYLHDIKDEIGDNSKDVIDEVELRMAELLAERGITAEKVVLLQDVDYLKEQLGSPRDFKDDSSRSAEDSDQQGGAASTPKRLFRDTDNGMVAGVCAGLAKFFGIDATIVRLIFAALIIFGGGGLLLYVVLWLVVPQAKTNSDRLQMQGESVTVGSIKKIVDRADVSGATRRAHNVVAPFLHGVGRLLLVALGVLLIIVALANILGLMTTAVYVWSNNGLNVAGEHLFPVGIKDVLLLASAVTVGVIINLFFLLSGRALIRRKWSVPGWLSGGFLGLLLFGIAAGVALAFDTAPQLQQRVDALYHTSTAVVSPYQKLVVHSDRANVIYHPAASYKVEYRYLGKLVDFNQTVQDGTLTVDTTKAHLNGCNFACIHSDPDLIITIYAPALQSVSLTDDAQPGNRGYHSLSFNNSEPWTQPDLTVTATHNVNVALQYANPQKVVLTSNPEADSQTVELTGLQPQAFASDVVSMGGSNVNVTRTGTFELHTGAQCTSDMPLAMLSNYPATVIINGQTYPTKGDLLGTQKNEQSLAANCVQTIDQTIYN